MIIPINLDTGSYPIEIERGALHRARELFRLDRKVLVVTDSGVPACYAEEIAAAAKEPYLVTVPQGEESKSLSAFEKASSISLALYIASTGESFSSSAPSCVSVVLSSLWWRLSLHSLRRRTLLMTAVLPDCG